MPHVGPEVEGHQAKIGRSTPKIVIFGPFLAFEGRLGGLNDPLEVRLGYKTCRTIHGTHLEGILSQKNWTGLAGGVKNGQFLVKIWLRSPPQAPEWVNNP
jgi:hypothetical protein